jgi:hypothetical protein
LPEKTISVAPIEDAIVAFGGLETLLVTSKVEQISLPMERVAASLKMSVPVPPSVNTNSDPPMLYIEEEIVISLMIYSWSHVEV